MSKEKTLLYINNVFHEYGLTKREIEIASLMVMKGMKNEEIAGLIRCSLVTVKQHVSGIYRKLNVNNRGEFISTMFLNYINSSEQ